MFCSQLSWNEHERCISYGLNRIARAQVREMPSCESTPIERFYKRCSILCNRTKIYIASLSAILRTSVVRECFCLDRVVLYGIFVESPNRIMFVRIPFGQWVWCIIHFYAYSGMHTRNDPLEKKFSFFRVCVTRWAGEILNCTVCVCFFCIALFQFSVMKFFVYTLWSICWNFSFSFINSWFIGTEIVIEYFAVVQWSWMTSIQVDPVPGSNKHALINRWNNSNLN